MHYAAARVDAYVLDTLMRDLVGHDRSPAAFVVYLLLWRHTFASRRRSVRLSLQALADGTGLSKSAVQNALRLLTRRRLVRAERAAPTAVPEYFPLRPWRR